MAAITTIEVAGTGATVLGTPLSNAQIDNNFININTDVVQTIATRYTKDETDSQSIAFSLALG